MLTFWTEYSVSHFLRLSKKVLRHHSRKRRLKLGLPPLPPSAEHDIEDDSLSILNRYWETLDKSGVRIGSNNKWRGITLDNAVSLPSPPPNQLPRRQDPLTKTLAKRHSLPTPKGNTIPDAPLEKLRHCLVGLRLRTSHQVAQFHRAGRIVLRKYGVRHSKETIRRRDGGSPRTATIPGSSSAGKNGTRERRMVVNAKARTSQYYQVLGRRYGGKVTSESEKPTLQPRLCMHSSVVWHTLTGHGKDFQKVPRFEWQALLGIASAGKEGVLQPDLVKITGQDKRSLPHRTSELTKKGHIIKRSVLKSSCKTSKMWLKRFAPALLESGPVDVSRAALAGNADCVSWHQRWTGPTIDYLALGQTAIAIIKAYEVMKYVDLKKKLGVLGLRWQMRVLARTLRYWGGCGVIKYVAASLEGTVFRDCLKYVKPPTEEQWRKYLAPSGIRKSAPKGQRKAEKAAAFAKARKEVRRRDGALKTALHTHPAWKFYQPSQWRAERPIADTIFETVKRAGSEGTTNRKLARSTLSRDYQRLFSRMALALTTASQPKHLGHLKLVGHKKRQGKILQYQYFTISSYHRAVEQDAKKIDPVIDPTSKPRPKTKSPLRYSPNVFSRHRPSITCAAPHTLTDLASLCKPASTKSKRMPAKTGNSNVPRKGRPPKTTLSARSHQRKKPKARSAQPTADESGEPEGQPVAQVEATPVAVATRGAKRARVTEDGTQSEPEVKRPRLEKVYLGEKNSLESPRKTHKKRQGRPKKSTVVVFNLNAFSEETRRKFSSGWLPQQPASASLPPPVVPDKAISQAGAAVETEVRDATRQPPDAELENPGEQSQNSVPKNTSSPKNPSSREPAALTDQLQPPPPSAAPENQDKAPAKRGRKPGRGAGKYRCEKCGNSWRNENGLAYHLTKARTACNPNYDPDAVPLPPPHKPKPISVPKAPSPKPDITVARSVTGRPMRSARFNRPQTSFDHFDDLSRPVSESSKPKKPKLLKSYANRALGSPSSVKPRPKRTKKAVLELLPEPRASTPVRSDEPAEPNANHRLIQRHYGVTEIGKGEPLSTRVKDDYCRDEDKESAQQEPIPETPRKGVRFQDTHTKELMKLHPKDSPRLGNHTGSSPSPSTSLQNRHSPTGGFTAEQLKKALPLGNDSYVFKIPGLVYSGAELASNQGTELATIPGEISGFIPEPFLANDHAKEYAAVRKAPVHFWVRTILDYLCRQNGGVFPGFKAAYIGLLVIWHRHLSPDLSVPQSQTVSRAVEDQHDIEPEICRFRFQAIHAGRVPVTFELFHVPGSDPNGPVATVVKRRIVEAYPAVYVPRAFSPTLEELREFGVHFEKGRENKDLGRAARKLAPEIEVLEAPYYLVQSFGEGAKQLGSHPLLSKPNKRRKIEHRDSEHRGLPGRPKDRTWKRVYSVPVFMQDFGRGTWDGAPMPTLVQRWPRVLVKKAPQRRKRVNPGLETLPFSFWSCTDSTLPSERSSAGKLPRSLHDVPGLDVEGHGPEAEALGWEEMISGFDKAIGQVQSWELSTEGQLHFISSSVIPGSAYINLGLPSGGYFPQVPRVPLWRDEDQCTMTTLDYARCGALDRCRDVQGNAAFKRSSPLATGERICLPYNGNAGDSTYSRYYKTPRRRLIKEPKLGAKAGIVAHVIDDDYRQRLTVWPETKNDFPPRMGFFGLRSGQNASLTPLEQRLLITGFVCVGCLAGGINHTVDFGLMMRIFPEFTKSALAKFWLKARKERSSFVQRLTVKFEEKFPAGYANGELPQVDFQNLLGYDWKWLIKWVMDLNPDEGEKDLPENIDELLESRDGKDTTNPDMDWRDNFYNRQASVFSRMRSFCLNSFCEPCSPKPQPEDFKDLSRARSYVKSLCCTPVAGKHSAEDIKTRLIALSPEQDRAAATRLLQRASIELNNQRVTVKGNAHKDPVTGNFRLQGNFMKGFDRYCKLDRFEQAVNFKAQLDTVFKEGNTVRIRYDSGEGTVLSIIDMQFHGRLHSDGVNIPYIPLGFVPGNYETRKYDTSKNLRWKIHIKPTDAWVYDEDLRIGENPAVAEIPSAGPHGEVPMWRDLFGDSNPELWLKALSYFVFTVATKGPTTGVPDVCFITKPYLERFEAQLLLDWCVRAGVFVPVPHGKPGYTVGEWWWWIVGKTKLLHCGDREIVEPNRLKLATDKPVRTRPRKRNPTIAVRCAAQEMALQARKEDMRREKEEKKKKGVLTRNKPNRALLKGPAEKLMYGGAGGADPMDIEAPETS
ncbi:hypothetical protein MKZ38_007044 [Zalerion maritima]|uniref:C2H2-type domain-containing protein n=1 Tax=Zalerion maritima TaxID=339359 RepID=A0AAD5RV40_9PEZI|nr:hypothetical protein MKZ38_007044 [Zalerion maritima]